MCSKRYQDAQLIYKRHRVWALLESQWGTVGRLGQQRPSSNRCFRRIIAEKVKAIHRTFYFQSVEDRPNSNTRKEILKNVNFS